MNHRYDKALKDYIEFSGDTPWVVTAVVPSEDYSLNLTFKDGSHKRYDCTSLLDKGIFKPLSDVRFFMKAYADGTTVAWSDDIDIAPEELYDNSVPINN